mmetsp:Transcript_5410/g.8521  ORF Transcript_5410/g.8521 Transcript_5410/m.8521 type:complete len:476 (-) Transcript_5410:124-1551(-)
MGVLKEKLSSIRRSNRGYEPVVTKDNPKSKKKRSFFSKRDKNTKKKNTTAKQQQNDSLLLNLDPIETWSESEGEEESPLATGKSWSPGLEDDTVSSMLPVIPGSPSYLMRVNDPPSIIEITSEEVHDTSKNNQNRTFAEQINKKQHMIDALKDILKQVKENRMVESIDNANTKGSSSELVTVGIVGLHPGQLREKRKPLNYSTTNPQMLGPVLDKLSAKRRDLRCFLLVLFIYIMTTASLLPKAKNHILSLLPTMSHSRQEQAANHRYVDDSSSTSPSSTNTTASQYVNHRYTAVIRFHNNERAPVVWSSFNLLERPLMLWNQHYEPASFYQLNVFMEHLVKTYNAPKNAIQFVQTNDDETRILQIAPSNQIQSVSLMLHQWDHPTRAPTTKYSECLAYWQLPKSNTAADVNSVQYKYINYELDDDDLLEAQSGCWKYNKVDDEYHHSTENAQRMNSKVDEYKLSKVDEYQLSTP